MDERGRPLRIFLGRSPPKEREDLLDSESFEKLLESPRVDLGHLDIPSRYLRVYELVGRIPRGFVSTYGNVGRLCGLSPRLVGKALARNPLPLLIPCHRVVRSDGSLGGFSYGLDIKRELLELEGVGFSNNRVSRKFFYSLDS